MFRLRQTRRPSGVYDIDQSEFDKEYPKESFDVTDPDNSPVESVIYYCCGILDESMLYSLTMDCFGSAVDLAIRPEMSILLEQIDKLIAFLRQDSRETETINFFEQGCKIEIHFSNQGDNIDVRIGFVDEEKTIHGSLKRQALMTSLSQFVLDFIAAVSWLTPAIVSEAAFAEWFRRLLASTA